MRRSAQQLEALAVDAAVAALESVDIAVTSVTRDTHDDAVLDVPVDDRPFKIPLQVVSYCTIERAEQLARRRGGPQVGIHPMVVAEKITTEARSRLAAAGWSWLDRRGRLHLRGPAVRVDVDLPRATTSQPTRGSSGPIAGRGGVAVAYWLCAHPRERLSPTHSAPALGVAPSTISTAVQRLADAGLVDDGVGLFPELFWELAAVWRRDRTWLAIAPEPALHRSPDPYASTWRRTGSAAAAVYGAPIVITEGGPVELYVPGPVDVSIAVRRYGAAEAGAGGAVLTVAPAAAVTAGVGDDHPLRVDEWPAAPRTAVALDLAQDKARGREILEDWRVPDAVWI